MFQKIKKQKTKKIIKNKQLNLFFIIFLFLTSCGISYSSQEADEYRSGTEGVVISFFGENFIFYDEQYLNLQLMLQNKGAYDEPQGKIVLSGYDPSIIKISTEPIELPDELNGKNRFTPEGSIYFVDVEEDAPVSLSLGESYQTNIQASLCYSYQTIATPTACILYTPEDNYICEQETISLATQGGPVAVTEIQQDYMQDKVRFTAVIQHLGDGTVVNAYDVDAYERCPFLLQRDDLNHVNVKMEISGLSEPACIPSNGYLALNDKGTGIIICTFTLREQRSYTTPLKITVDYLYLSVANQDISVVKSSSADEGSSGLGTTSWGDVGDGIPSDDETFGSGCYCSEANMKRWGGCICLYINGQMYYCSEGENKIPSSAKSGEIVEYQIKGSSTINKCGDSVSPSTDCPFTGTTTVPRKLSIYGTVTDGRTVSERCNLIVE